MAARSCLQRCESIVRLSHDTDDTVAPFLRHYPVDGVVGVIDFVIIGVCGIAALGAKSPTNILCDVGKAVIGKKMRRRWLIHRFRSGAVGQPRKDDRKRPPARRQIDICQQIGAIPHLDLHVLGHANAATADGCLQ